jgi:hypothetical protein
LALDKQINLFKVDTDAFLSYREIQDKICLSDIEKYKSELNKIIKKLKKSKDISDSYDYNNLCKKIKEINKDIKREKKIYKSLLLDDAKKAVEYNNKSNNKKIRELNRQKLFYIDKNGNEKINVKNVVSMFESTLSRSFDIKTNELTYDIFIVEIYYYDIAQDLILNGFNYNNKHYVYFSSSAGQIRTKKAVFVEEQKYIKCQPKLMCGLTINKINEKGGMNINKYLAYCALSNSATDLWEDIFNKNFDIDKTIIVDDFETLVKCKVDNIDYNTYEITPNVIQDIPITHTDGCGMILSSYSNKNFMVRLPFIKGLLGSFDFIKFIKDNNCSPIIKDIWGKEYNIIQEDIQIIFTKSQLKMYKYYDSWDQYKEYFKKYNCEAGICNMEEDKISNARINYQMLQTLYKMTDAEVSDICEYSNKKIKEVSNSLENMLRFFGIYQDDNKINKDSFQEALKIYPELLNDESNRQDLKDLKNSLINKYRSGKLDVVGKFTFVLPDLYAFCEWLFLKDEKPKGLLEDKEVFCKLYKNSKELDCLRSPSLYIEHAIRNNVCNKKYRNQKLEDWFQTDAIYTSTYDLISKILQFDVDGDRLLVLAQKSLISIAKRHMEGVNPLYYEMKKAKAEEINPENMYKGLKLAFTGGNIGAISNDITKIWSQENITAEELKAVRWLCMETNFTIDYAKTLFKPKRPEKVDEILKKYHSMKVPYFFVYAKDKENEKVEKITNSTINKILSEIKDNKIMFNSIRNLNKIDYRMMLRNKECNYTNNVINKFYDQINKKYGNNLRIEKEDPEKNNINFVIQEVKKDFLTLEPNEYNVIQSLVKYLYKKESSKKKKLLWYMYGDELLNNIKNNIDKSTDVCMQCGKRVNKNTLIRHKCRQCRDKEIKKNGGKKIIRCIDCGKEFEVDWNSRRKNRCDDCYEKYRREKIRKNVENLRKKKM